MFEIVDTSALLQTLRRNVPVDSIALVVAAVGPCQVAAVVPLVVECDASTPHRLPSDDAPREEVPWTLRLPHIQHRTTDWQLRHRPHEKCQIQEESKCPWLVVPESKMRTMRTTMRMMRTMMVVVWSVPWIGWTGANTHRIVDVAWHVLVPTVPSRFPRHSKRPVPFPSNTTAEVPPRTDSVGPIDAMRPGSMATRPRRVESISISIIILVVCCYQIEKRSIQK